MTTAVATAARRYAIRMIDGEWHRWDNFAAEWQRFSRLRIAIGPEHAAREYAAGLYGVRPRQVTTCPAGDQ